LGADGCVEPKAGSERLLEKERARSIFGLALPIIGGMVSQNVLNLVDTAMVGTLGDAALAAVGLGGFANFMCMALILGISTGVQATASRRKGEGKVERMAVSLNAAIVLILIVAPPLTAALYFLIPKAYHFLNNDPDVMAQGIPYLQMRVLAIVCVGINFSFRGYWNGINRSMLYMSTLIVMHASNIFLNWVLIFGNLGAPRMGASGAGLATTLSTVIGVSVYFYLGWRHARDNGFLRARPSVEEFRTLVRLSLPNGVQQLFFAAGFTALYWIIGKVGTVELAAANVLINVTLVALLPGIALGLAAATLVGQALGRENTDDAAQWGWDVVKSAMLVMGSLGLPMLLIPDLILSVFIHNPETMEAARWPMRLVGATMSLEAIGMVLMNALLGAGDSRRVMMVSIVMQWLLFLPLAYVVGPVMGWGLLGIWVLQGCYRLCLGLVFAGMWRGRRWAGIQV